eukprot:TRINITY_DN3058_c0_g1_i1.p1 TRINITY_DN3058_c0_g1~~TRINITY_DN3058_c0_g1_i1.p1  ORF type:complete len:185 (-),score=61.75 TRINITY_DN3058_c0_g1_i1:16-570(-)
MAEKHNKARRKTTKGMTMMSQVCAFLVVSLLVTGAFANEKEPERKAEVTTYEYWMEYYADHPSRGAESRPVTEASEPFNPIDHIPLIGLTSAAIVITGACIAACVLVAYGKWKYPDSPSSRNNSASPPSDASYSGGADLSDDDLENQISISESPIPGHGPDPLNDNDLGLDDEDEEDDDDFGQL